MLPRWRPDIIDSVLNYRSSSEKDFRTGVVFQEAHLTRTTARTLRPPEGSKANQERRLEPVSHPVVGDVGFG